MNSQSYCVDSSFFEFTVSSYKFEIEHNAGASFDIYIYNDNKLVCYLLNLSSTERILPLVQDFFVRLYERLLVCSQLIVIYRRFEFVDKILEQTSIQIPQLNPHTNSLQFLLDNIYRRFSKFIVLLHASRFNPSIVQSYVRGILNEITYLNWACQLHEQVKSLYSFSRKQSASDISKADERVLQKLMLQLVIREKMSFLRLFKAEFLNRMKDSFSSSMQATLDQISLDLFFPPSEL